MHSAGVIIIRRLYTELALITTGATGAEMINLAHVATSVKEPCQFFAAGKCVFGEACRNAHVNPEQTVIPEGKKKVHPIYARLQEAEASINQLTECARCLQGFVGDATVLFRFV